MTDHRRRLQERGDGGPIIAVSSQSQFQCFDDVVDVVRTKLANDFGMSCGDEFVSAVAEAVFSTVTDIQHAEAAGLPYSAKFRKITLGLESCSYVVYPPTTQFQDISHNVLAYVFGYDLPISP